MCVCVYVCNYVCVCVYVCGVFLCVYGTIQLPRDGFSWNFVLVLKSVKKIEV